jgi:hypothetical protein
MSSREGVDSDLAVNRLLPQIKRTQVWQHEADEIRQGSGIDPLSFSGPCESGREIASGFRRDKENDDGKIYNERYVEIATLTARRRSEATAA